MRHWASATRNAPGGHRLGVQHRRGLAPAELNEVCRTHGALLLVDEAHGLGYRGAGGRGLLHELSLAGAPDGDDDDAVQGAGQPGRRRAGSEAVRDHLIDAARPFIFDTGLAPAAVGAALEALRVLADEPWRPEAVHAHAAYLADVCGVTQSPQSAVVSVIPVTGAGGRRRGRLPDGGVRVGVSAPTVPPGTSAAAADRAGVAVRRRSSTWPERSSPRCSARSAASVSRRHRHRNRRWQDRRHRRWQTTRAAPGSDVAVYKPVQTGSSADGDGDDDLAEVARLAGVTDLVSVARHPEPRWHPWLPPSWQAGPCRRRERSLAAVRAVDRPGWLTPLEGAAACSWSWPGW